MIFGNEPIPRGRDTACFRWHAADATQPPKHYSICALVAPILYTTAHSLPSSTITIPCLSRTPLCFYAALRHSSQRSLWLASRLIVLPSIVNTFDKSSIIIIIIIAVVVISAMTRGLLHPAPARQFPACSLVLRADRSRHFASVPACCSVRASSNPEQKAASVEGSMLSSYLFTRGQKALQQLDIRFYQTSRWEQQLRSLYKRLPQRQKHLKSRASLLSTLKPRLRVATAANQSQFTTMHQLTVCIGSQGRIT